MVAFGVSGIGEVQGAFFQNRKKLSTYYEALDGGGLPVEKGYALDEDDKIRQHVIKQIMCNFKVVKADVNRRFGIDFDEYFQVSLDALQEVKDAGFVEIDSQILRVREEGRLFVRNVCMAFDRYLETKGTAKPVFSRTV
jgi:oxygen-independent coproporphyrinogen-3 oxidase